jgi:hypothetical protein
MSETQNSIFTTNNYEMQASILDSIDLYLSKNGYKNYFIDYKIVDLKGFEEQTKTFMAEIKNDLKNIHNNKND